MIYVNQCGTTWPKPARVHEAVAASLAAPPETWTEEIDRNHRAVCAHLGVLDPSRLLLTSGATSALAIATSDHPWTRGDRILVSTMEHHALIRPCELLRPSGVELTVLPRAADGPLDLDALRAELARGRVRLVALSAASNVTGEMLPIHAAIELAHAHGALVLVDAAQWAGWADIDVATLGADLLAFAGHKAPHGPHGIGGLHVSPHVRMQTPGATCEIDTPRARCAPMPGYCDAGSVNRVALAGLVAGLEWMGDAVARADRLSVARDLAARFEERVRELPGVRVHAAQAATQRMPIVAFTTDDCPPATLDTALRGRDVVVGVGFQCAPLAHEALGTARTGVLRVSFGPLNDLRDADAVASAIADVLVEVRT